MLLKAVLHGTFVEFHEGSCGEFMVLVGRAVVGSGERGDVGGDVDATATNVGRDKFGTHPGTDTILQPMLIPNGVL